MFCSIGSFHKHLDQHDFQSKLDNGRIYKWETAKVEVHNLTVEEIDIDELKNKDYKNTLEESVLYVSKEFKSFQNGIYFCEDLKGKIAVPNDNINMNKWIEMTYKHHVDCDGRFFIGYIQSDKKYQFSR